MKTSILLVLLFFAFASCTSLPEDGRLTISNGRFADSKDREVILNGINHVNKKTEQNHIDPNDKAHFMQFRDWGFNIVRFGVNWAELEPSPGMINEYYLTQLDERVQWAEALGIWLYLDFHQDLYGVGMGNGAPKWATITDEQAHVTGEIWSDSYILSGAVHRAFDHFWNNTLASDGIGLQDHYLNCLRLVSERYKNSPSVAGYDVMNEPFMGSGSVEVLPFLMSGFATGLKKCRGESVKADEIAADWSVNEKKMQLIETLNDKAIYQEMVMAADSVVNVFETGALSDFYQKARDVIRATGSRQILFLEHSYFCNLGIPSRFKMPVDQDGKPDGLCCYAPHGYDLVTDSKNNTMQGRGRVEFIFDQIVKNSVRKSAPVMIGEWGAYYDGNQAFTAASAHSIGIFEKHQFSQSYWAYWESIGRHEYFTETIVRNYPMATNGELFMYKNDFENKTYTQKWNENGSAKGKTLVFVKNIDKSLINISPVSDFEKIKIGNTQNGYLEIEPLGCERELTITSLSPLN